MIEFMIKPADEALVGDIITMPVRSGEHDREIHCIGRVLEISNPHPDITEFNLNLFAHIDERKEGKFRIGIRHDAKIAIMRKKP